MGPVSNVPAVFH